MPRVEVPEVKIRTTSASEGHPHAIAIGTGPAPQAALEELKSAARVLAESVGERYSSASDSRGFTSRELLDGRGETFSPRDPKSLVWRFEVIDLRLVPGLVEMASGETGTGWVAYGTLIAMTESPVRPSPAVP